MASKKPVEPPIVEIDGVPTAEGLVRMGTTYATRSTSGHIRITERGHALIGEKLRESAEKGTSRGAGVNYQPDLVRDHQRSWK